MKSKLFATGGNGPKNNDAPAPDLDDNDDVDTSDCPTFDPSKKTDVPK